VSLLLVWRVPLRSASPFAPPYSTYPPRFDIFFAVFFSLAEAVALALSLRLPAAGVAWASVALPLLRRLYLSSDEEVLADLRGRFGGGASESSDEGARGVGDRGARRLPFRSMGVSFSGEERGEWVIEVALNSLASDPTATINAL